MTARAKAEREALTFARAETLRLAVEAWITGARWEAEAHLDAAHSLHLKLEPHAS